MQADLMAAVASGAPIAELEWRLGASLGRAARRPHDVAGQLSVTDFPDAPIAEAG
jgi:hypothetical protein